MVVNYNAALVIGELANTIDNAIQANADSEDKIEAYNNIMSLLYRICYDYNVNIDNVRSAVALLNRTYLFDNAESSTPTEKKEEDE